MTGRNGRLNLPVSPQTSWSVCSKLEVSDRCRGLQRVPRVVAALRRSPALSREYGRERIRHWSRKMMRRWLIHAR
jgi:hypothetical protein